MPLRLDESISAPLTPVSANREALSARASMRAQIARMEGRLGILAAELGASGRACPLPPGAPIRPTGSSTRVRLPVVPSSGPRLLTLGELEVARDELVCRIRATERALERCVDAEASTRARLNSMLADPGAHRFEIIHRAQLGEPGCGAYQVRPRLGLLGMLFGWWCVKLSSGCPLSMANHHRAHALLAYHDVPLRAP